MPQEQIPTLRINTYRQRVVSLAKSLPDKSDAEWLVAVYLSLGTAEELGYKEDSHARLDRQVRDASNAEMLSKDSFHLFPSSEVERSWLAGHFFNNALFRMVALAEITLRTLFYRNVNMNLEPPIKYWWLVNWYKDNFGGKLLYIHNARARVNKFKHEPRERTRPKALETYDDALKALEELLVLMALVVDPAPTKN